ncbi:MAG TPA: hypothetical protein VMH84_13710 [Xanthobacteraceae bacterium]|nr:hypothetical protein [Xanthobacteraceae bacterium]
MTYRRGFIAIAALALSLSQMPVASAEDWPTKPVHILVGFGAGGGTDVATRVVANALSKALGQQFFVENRVGAGGTMRAVSSPNRRTTATPCSRSAWRTPFRPSW